MSQVPGDMVQDAPNGISTAKLNANALSADVAGRSKMQGGYFDAATALTKIAAAALADSLLTESYLKADGTRALSGNLSAGGNKITNLAAPTAAGDAVTKAYADAMSSGLDPKASVRLATAAALPACTAAGSGVGKTLTANANGALTVDGVAVAVADRILVQNQAAGANNGIYTVTATGGAGAPWVLTRATDADSSTEVTPGLYCFVEEGTVYASCGMLLTTLAITLDTTALVFVQFSAAGVINAGAGLTKTGTTLDVVAADGSITVNADSIQVTFGAAGAVAAASANGTAASSSHSDHTHAAPIAWNANQGMACEATAANYDRACATAIAKTPGLGSRVNVVVCGVKQTVGDAVRTKDCYFSGDGGTTPRAMNAIVAGDFLYWVGTVAGFQLATSYTVDFDIEAFS